MRIPHSTLANAVLASAGTLALLSWTLVLQGDAPAGPVQDARDATAPAGAKSVKGMKLKVSPNGRYFVDQDGKPFFYLGDTAWLLFQRFNHEEVEEYLRDRAGKGFTVIQAYVLRGLGARHPDGNRSLLGETPFIDRDPARPNEAFFKNMDHIINRANELGLVVGLVVAKSWHVNKHPERVFDAKNAYVFGKFLGQRYKNNAVMWYVGGDSAPGNDAAAWVAMARGLKDGSGGTQLVSYHGSGQTTSSTWFHDADWLDFNSIQSGHGWAAKTYRFIDQDYGRTPPKPTVDMEPPYENHPTGAKTPRIDSHQVRQGAYWNMLSGAAGHGYGALDLFWLYKDSDGPFPKNGFQPWRKAMAYEGARQMGFMRRLFEQRPWYKLVPDQSVIDDGQGEGNDHVRAARAKDGSFVVAYLPTGKPVRIKTDKVSGQEVIARWYNPRKGTWIPAGRFANKGVREFAAPSRGEKEDWVLVLDDAASAARPDTVRAQQTEGASAVDRYGDALPPGAMTRLGTVRYRFGGLGTAFLPDGKTVVCAKNGGPIVFWEARTGRPLREINTGRFSIGQHLTLSRDRKRLAVTGSVHGDGKSGWRFAVRVYETASGNLLWTQEREPRDGVNALALSPDGKLLFTLGGMGSLRIVEVETGVELLRQQFPRDVMSHVALSPDGSTLAVASGPNTRKIFVWKWEAADEPRELKTSGYRGRSLAFSPDGKRLADCSDIDATVRVWDVEGRRLLHKLELPDHESYWHHHVAFSPDGKVVAASGATNEKGAVHLWDPANGEFQKRLPMGAGELAFSPDGTLLADGSSVWDFAARKELSGNDEAHRGEVDHILGAANNQVVTTAHDNTIRFWDGETGKQLRKLSHGGWIRDVALSPDGRLLVSNSLDDTVSLWDFATGKKTYALAGHGRMGGRRAVVFAPDGKSFLAWGDDMYLRRWDVRTGKALSEHAIRPTGIPVPGEDDDDRGAREFTFLLGSGRFTPEGKHLILQAGADFFVFDTATGRELRKFPCEGGHVIAMTVSPDGKLLLASAWGKSVRTKLPDGTMQSSTPEIHPVTLWDLTTGERKKQIFLPERGAGPVAFSPDGKQFAVASSNPGDRIRVLETETGKELRRIEGFRGTVRSLAFLPDGRRLVSGMDDSTALIWDLTREP
jgi:WD40 repeat protein